MNDKPKGYYKYALVLDCETSSLAFGAENPTYDPVTKQTYQSVAWGLIVVDTETLDTVEELYVEIMWDGHSVWAPEAEKIHGLSKSHLEKMGLSSEEAVEEIGGLILKYWGPTNAIRAIGHNVAFDIAFLKSLFKKFDIELKFGHRHCDTSGLGFAIFGTYTSDELFQAVGFTERKAHNALEDARMALEVVRRIRKVWNKCVGE